MPEAITEQIKKYEYIIESLETDKEKLKIHLALIEYLEREAKECYKQL